MQHYKEKRIEIAFIKESGYGMSEPINREDTIEVYVYLDTVNHEYNGDDNLCVLILPTEYVKKYVKEHSEYSSFEEWLEEYTCDDTEDLYARAILDGLEFEVINYNTLVNQKKN